jgi:beta-glucanase (GH16 family)
MVFRLINIIFVFFVFTTSANAQCYQQVWADEFNGTTLDLTKWTPIVGPGGVVAGNNELQYYTDRPANTQVSGGTLKIIALQENYGGNAYTSARMQTKLQGDWLYGRMEARMKLPVGIGMWPAFWLMPTESAYGNWPKSGEIDIMELIGKEPSNVYGTIHSHDANNNVRSFSTKYSLASGTFADDFHIFSMEWSPNKIQFFVDGNLYATKTPTDLAPSPWRFDKKFYILLNLAMGGAWAGSPDATTTFPQVMEVDYVRVYQKINNIDIKGNTLVEPNTQAATYTVPAMPGVAYNWSVTGNSIVSGQNTNQIKVNWGTNNSIMSLAMNDGCLPSATISTVVLVSPNLWSNFGFEYNYISWDTRPAYSSNVNFGITTTSVSEGKRAATIQVLNTGTNPWDIQLSRTNITLNAGTSYTLRFKAKADSPRSIPVSFIRSADYSTVANKTIALTTAWQQFSLVFTPTTTVNVMFNADLAAAIGTYYFDDFMFARTVIVP